MQTFSHVRNFSNYGVCWESSLGAKAWGGLEREKICHLLLAINERLC